MIKPAPLSKKPLKKNKLHPFSLKATASLSRSSLWGMCRPFSLMGNSTHAKICPENTVLPAIRAKVSTTKPVAAPTIASSSILRICLGNFHEVLFLGMFIVYCPTTAFGRGEVSPGARNGNVLYGTPTCVSTVYGYALLVKPGVVGKPNKTLKNLENGEFGGSAE